MFCVVINQLITTGAMSRSSLNLCSQVFTSAEETDDNRSTTIPRDTTINVGSAVVRLCIMQTYFMTDPGVRTKFIFPVFLFILAMCKLLQTKVSCRNEIKHIAVHRLCMLSH